jgi:fumarate reductase subunit D
MAETTKQEQKIWAAASYLWILSLVVLAARKNNEFIRFHANQGVILFIISLLALLTGPLMFIINIFVVIAAVAGIIKAIQGEKWQLPLLGGIAKSVGDWLIKTLKI